MNIASNKANEINKCHCLTLGIFSHARIFLWFLTQTQTTIHAMQALSTVFLASPTFGYFFYFFSKRLPCHIKILIVFTFPLHEFQGLSNSLGFSLTLLPMHFFHLSAGNVNYFCVNENWVKSPFFKQDFQFSRAQSSAMLSCLILAVFPNLQVLSCFVI